MKLARASGKESEERSLGTDLTLTFRTSIGRGIGSFK